MISSREKEIIIGTILGDGHIAMQKSNARLEIGHSFKQNEYVDWKYDELSSFSLKKPHIVTIEDARYNKIYKQYRFKTRANKLFTELHGLFYQGHKKIIPKIFLPC